MNTYFLTASRDMIFSLKQTFVQHQAATIAASLEESFDVLTIEDVSKVMPFLDVSSITRVTITDAVGNILYGSVNSEERLNDGYSVEHITRTLEGFDIFYSKFSGGYFSSSAFTPVMSRGLVIGAVFVHDVDSDQGAILLDMQNTLKNISVVVIVFSFVMVAFILWTVMRRITSILKAIESVREGEYNYRININGSDELSMLGDEFNSLTDRLRVTEEIRRRFVANASHELRTPLASIRLLSDSILQNKGMDMDTVQEFISDIGTEAERLARTTEKLMSLTRLDSDIPNESTRVDMRRVVVSTLRMLRPLALSRGLTVNSSLEGECYIFATDDSLHQVVFNLVENAIKYNKPDGSVNVRLGREGENVVFTVDDTGIGVPDEDLPYIFDRFYRVDKARSRGDGGSGLGLAIVLDTVREHNGSISASRRVNGGMRFQVRFALYNPQESVI